jgi:hypothetical protein
MGLFDLRDMYQAILNLFIPETHQFPCQICGTVFQREISGTMLCKECGVNNQFNMIIDPKEKKNILLSYVTFPTYMILKDKTTMFHMENELKYKYHKDIIQNIKSLSTNVNLGNRYRLIKYLLKYLDEINYLQENYLKGIYIYSPTTSDILFVHHPNIQDQDRILYIDFHGLVNKLTLYRNKQQYL